MDSANETRLIRRTRKAVRFGRRLLLLIVLAVVLGIVWLNYFGVPGVLKRWVVRELSGRNFDVDVEHVRLEGFSEIVLEQARFNPSPELNLPRLLVQRGEVLLDPAALLQFKLQLRGVKVTEGQFELPLLQTPETLSVTNVQTELTFLPGDVWRLTQFSGRSLGAEVSVSAFITNSMSLARRVPPRPDTEEPGKWREHLAEFVRLAGNLNVDSPPQLSLSISGNALDWSSFRASARLSVRNAAINEGSVSALDARVRVIPAAGGLKSYTSCTIDNLRTADAWLEKIGLEGETEWASSVTNHFLAKWSAAVRRVESRWGQTRLVTAELSSTQPAEGGLYSTSIKAESTPVLGAPVESARLLFSATAEHSLPLPSLPRMIGRLFPGPALPSPAEAPTNYLDGTWSFAAEKIKGQRFRAETFTAGGDVRRRTGNIENQPDLGFWNAVRNLEGEFSTTLTNMAAEEIHIGSAMGVGNWRYPQLAISTIAAQLYGGGLDGSATLDIPSRRLETRVDAAFDYHKVALLFDPPVQRWLDQFAWNQPPRIEANTWLTLPSWTAPWTNVVKEVAPGIGIQGKLDGAGTFQGVSVERVTSDLQFTNFVWTLPNLLVVRPEGEARIAYMGNVTNSEFECKLESRIDPGALAPLFNEEEREALLFVRFPEPPGIEGELRGNWDSPQTLDFRGSLAATNFLVKNEPHADLKVFLHYTNSIIEGRDLVAHRIAGEEVRAPYLRVDIPREVMFVTNATSTANPYIAMSLIGRQVYKAIEPYQFAKPPFVIINGYIPLKHYSKADIHFDVKGGDFTYWKFHIPELSGHVYWQGDNLDITGVQASFYGGRATWEGSFVFDKNNDTDFSFKAHVTDGNLRPLITDILEGTNHMEGIFTGNLVVTSARSDDPRSWDGYGSVQLRDGFLWNVPVFGVFSTLLEAISPGLGVSRVSAGTATFTMTNTVIHTRDMEVRAPAFRLKYRGQVDLDGRLDAVVEAMLLRDAWVFGRAFSLALWPVSKAFEARVTGTMDNPQTRLRYVPRFLLAPLRALNALRQGASKAPPVVIEEGEEPPEGD